MDRNKRNNPGDYLKKMLGREVEVKLNDNHTFYTGIMTCLDGNMNVLLSNAKELNKDKLVEEFKQVLIRGNNVLFIKKKN